VAVNFGLLAVALCLRSTMHGNQAGELLSKILWPRILSIVTGLKRATSLREGSELSVSNPTHKL